MGPAVDPGDLRVRGCGTAEGTGTKHTEHKDIGNGYGLHVDRAVVLDRVHAVTGVHTENTGHRLPPRRNGVTAPAAGDHRVFAKDDRVPGTTGLDTAGPSGCAVVALQDPLKGVFFGLIVGVSVNVDLPIVKHLGHPVADGYTDGGRVRGVGRPPVV